MERLKGFWRNRFSVSLNLASRTWDIVVLNAGSIANDSVAVAILPKEHKALKASLDAESYTLRVSSLADTFFSKFLIESAPNLMIPGRKSPKPSCQIILSLAFNLHATYPLGFVFRNAWRHPGRFLCPGKRETSSICKRRCSSVV
jgi:hypothetical protein